MDSIQIDRETNGACRELADLDPTPSILRRAMRKLVRR